MGKCTVERRIDQENAVAGIKGWERAMGEEEGGPYADPQPRGVCLRGWLRARAAQGERAGGPERLREGGHGELELSQAAHCPPHCPGLPGTCERDLV